MIRRNPIGTEPKLCGVMLFALVTLPALVTAQEIVERDGFGRPDALGVAGDFGQHYQVSAILGVAGWEYLEARGPLPFARQLVTTVGLALVPGVAKELADSTAPGNAFSGRDILADTAGALSGALALGLTGKPFILAVSSTFERLLLSFACPL